MIKISHGTIHNTYGQALDRKRSKSHPRENLTKNWRLSLGHSRDRLSVQETYLALIAWRNFSTESLVSSSPHAVRRAPSTLLDAARRRAAARLLELLLPVRRSADLADVVASDRARARAWISFANEKRGVIDAPLPEQVTLMAVYSVLK